MEQMIETLRKGYGKHDRMAPEGKAYKGICDLLDRSDDETLKTVYRANIKFVSALAFNRMIRRGIHEAR